MTPARRALSTADERFSERGTRSRTALLLFGTFRVLERAPLLFEALARGAGPRLTGHPASEPARSTAFEHGPATRRGTRIEKTRGRLARVRRSPFGSRPRFRDDRLVRIGGL